MRKSRAWMILALLVLLLVLRTRALYQAATAQTTLYRSAQIGLEFRIARATGQNFYQFHARTNRQLAQRLPPEQRPLMADLDRVEYPPLAVLWMALPSYFLPGPAPDLFLQDDLASHFDAYARVYVRLIIAVDLVLCAVLLFFSFRVPFPGESVMSWIRPLAFYILCTRLMDELVYTRMDLLVGFLLIGSLWALVSSAPTWIGYVLLALAINLRITPVLWVPLFVVASIPANRISLLRVAWGCLFVAILSLGLFGGLALCLGPGSLAFATYHAQRGLHIESLLGSFFMLGQCLGSDAHTSFAHGAYDVVSPLANHFAGLAAYFAAVLIGGTYFIVSRWTARRCKELEFSPSTPLGKAYPLELARLALLTMIAALLGSPVFSPQYLLWIVPLIGLLPARNKTEAATLFAMAAVFALTFVLYTRLYYTDLVPKILSPEQTWTYLRPHLRGTVLLLVRNGLLVLSAIGLAISSSQRRPLPRRRPSNSTDHSPTTAAPNRR